MLTLGSGAFVTILLAFGFGYLCGSIPFGLILTRSAGMGDVRNVGSGNIGATNVLRTGRKDLAAATLLFDALKGTAAVLIARAVTGEGAALTAGVFAGLGAFLGHIFPVWLRFRGGKGMATFLGVLLGFAWPAFVASALAWLGVAALSRYSSLATLAASVAGTLASPFFLPGWAVAIVAAMTLVLFWAHRENIGRLLAGKESRIGKRP